MEISVDAYLLVPMALLLVAVGASIGSRYALHARQKEKKQRAPASTIPIQSAVDVWCVTYTKTSDAELESAKFFAVAHTAGLVATSTMFSYYKTSEAILIAGAAFLFGLYFSVIPIARAWRRHGDHANQIAKSIRQSKDPHLVPMRLPVITRHKNAGWSFLITMSLLAAGVTGLSFAVAFKV